MLAAILSAAALLAPLVAAQNPGDSVARCSITGSGLAGSMSEEVAAEIVEIASLYLCGNGTATRRTALATAEDIATATAFAITSASADCFATGNSRFRLNGRSAAGSEAFAIGSATIEVSATVEVCGECSAAAALWASAYREIIISASASSEIALSGESSPDLPPLEARVTDFEAQFVVSTVDLTADVLLTLRGAVDEGCNATILLQLGNEFTGLDCNISAVGTADSISQTSTNIAISAATIATEKPCGVEVESGLNVSVSQVAEAMALAVADIRASCNIAGDAYVCALASAEVEAAANATAFAFAAAYAAETERCGANVCNIQVSQVASVCRQILVRATSALYLEQCSGPDSFFSISAFQSTLISVILEPFIEVIGSIQVIGGRCSVTVPVFAVPGEEPVTMMPPPMSMPPPAAQIPMCQEQCAEDNKVCFNKNWDAPRACCSPDYVCIRRDEDFSQCRLNGRPGTRVEWDGREEVCTPRM